MNLCDKYGWTEQEYDNQSAKHINKLFNYLLITSEQE